MKLFSTMGSTSTLSLLRTEQLFGGIFMVVQTNLNRVAARLYFCISAVTVFLDFFVVLPDLSTCPP